MELGLAGRGCVVTGAGGDIGREVAERLRGEGANVLLLDGAEGALTAEDAGERLLAAAEDRFGALDVLVNAGGAPAADDDWGAHYENAVMMPLQAMRSACPAMAERGWGRVVNVCSSAGRRPNAAMPARSVADAALLSLSRLFADRYGKRGVLVNAVCCDPAAADPVGAAAAIVFLCSERASFVNGAAWSLGE